MVSFTLEFVALMPSFFLPLGCQSSCLIVKHEQLLGVLYLTPYTHLDIFHGSTLSKFWSWVHLLLRISLLQRDSDLGVSRAVQATEIAY